MTQEEKREIISIILFLSSQQQLTMIAGAIQALNQLIERTEPEKVEIDTDSEK